MNSDNEYKDNDFDFYDEKDRSGSGRFLLICFIIVFLVGLL